MPQPGRRGREAQKGLQMLYVYYGGVWWGEGPGRGDGPGPGNQGLENLTLHNSQP